MLLTRFIIARDVLLRHLRHPFIGDFYLFGVTFAQHYQFQQVQQLAAVAAGKAH
ncbi:hypothetical protein D3C86_1985150 [compost metagenome]